MDFSKLSAVFEKMEVISSRLAITAELANLFSNSSASEIRKLIYLCQGRVLPEYKGIEMGIGDKLAEQSISMVSGKSIKEIEAVYRKEGDLGKTAEILLLKKQQSLLQASELTVSKVYENFLKIATTSGEGSQDSKIKMLAELLANAEPSEAKILIRFVQGRLRLGAGDSTILDALSTFKKGDKSMRPVLERAYNLRSDLGFIAELLLEGNEEKIEQLKPEVFFPIRPALAERLNTPEQIMEKMGSCIAEGKFDGFRLQIHKKGEKVEIFSRKQEPITHMFPDIVAAAKKELTAKEVIMEGEAIAFDERNDKFLPFQVTIQRKRKHGIGAKAKEIPLRLFAFEILFADGKDYTLEKYSERRKKLASLIPKNSEVIRPAIFKPVENAAELQSFFNECISKGLEGIIAKDLNALYIAGARKFAWIKLKKSYGKLADTFDLVIVGYYLGKGKRTKFEFGGLLCAVYDDEKERFRTIAKVGTGFTEEMMEDFGKRLEKISLKEKPFEVDSKMEPDFWVNPEIVVEVNADEISKSPTHTCGMQEGSEEGLALRFPRMLGIRKDKSAKDATTEQEVLEMYELQQQR